MLQAGEHTWPFTFLLAWLAECPYQPHALVLVLPITVLNCEQTPPCLEGKVKDTLGAVYLAYHNG